MSEEPDFSNYDDDDYGDTTVDPREGAGLVVLVLIAVTVAIVTIIVASFL